VISPLERLSNWPLVELVLRETDGINRDLFLAAAASGLANTLILAIVNTAAEEARQGPIDMRYAAMFIVVMVIYVYSLRFTFSKINRLLENVVHSVRQRVANKLKHSELNVLDRVGRGDLYTALSQQTVTISESGMMIAASLQAILMIVFASIYMAFLSLPAFVLTVLLLAAGIIVYQRRQAEAQAMIRAAVETDVQYFDLVTQSIDGFKETKINEFRARDLYKDVEKFAASVRDLRVETNDLFTSQYVYSQSVFYIVIGAIVFVLPRFFSDYSAQLAEVTTAILFIVGPLSMTVNVIPRVIQANEAARKVQDVENALDELNRWGEELDDGIPPVQPVAAFERIEARDIEFAYRDPEGEEVFTIGPLSMSIESGEMLFIIGGNGSGKSTLLNVLTALYMPAGGSISFDGIEVTEDSAASYRSLFTAIFSDFHLFRRAYGLLGVDPAAVGTLLDTMQLTDKTAFEDDRFTSLDLSTGQKKRLALVVSLLDDRPIMLFDELAADQDPEFRQFLYEELLPELKKKGKTIVAITHDDRYFDVADRVLKMEYGQFVPYR